jgi:hypothetical protein
MLLLFQGLLWRHSRCRKDAARMFSDTFVATGGLFDASNDLLVIIKGIALTAEKKLRNRLVVQRVAHGPKIGA